MHRLIWAFSIILVSGFVAPIATSRAAPHPGTGTAMINQISNGHVFSQFGFQLSGRVQIPWILEPSDNKSKDFNLSYGTGRLNLKSEVLASTTNVDQYVKKYLRDYNMYGFNVLNVDSQAEKVILEVEKRNHSIKGKQYFIKSGSRVLIATCTDESASFDKTARMCQRFIEEMEWQN